MAKVDSEREEVEQLKVGQEDDFGCQVSFSIQFFFRKRNKAKT